MARPAWRIVLGAWLGMVLATPGAPVWAASRITTSDGTVITGEVERLQDDVYAIRTPYGLIQVPRQAVRRIESADQPSSACSGGTCPGGSGQPLRLAGSNTVGAELVPSLLEAYARSLGADDVQWLAGANPEERSLRAKASSSGSSSGKGASDRATGPTFEAEVSAHGSGTAPTALAEDKADIGMMSREINRDEVARVTAAGLGSILAPSQQHVLALDGLLVLVHRDNPVSRLTLENVAQIFSGEKTDWADFGGRAGPITVYRRADGSGTLDTFMALVMKKRKIASSAKPFESSTDLSDTVASDPSGIGFVGIAYARSARPLEIALECGLSYAPSEFLVKTEEYPLSRRLFLYNGANPRHPAATRFVEYALSRDVQPVIAKNQFIDLLIDRSEPTYASVRIADAARSGDRNRDLLGAYARALSGANRLSVTYRFTSGGSELDTRAVRDIDRLADYLREPGNRGRSVLVLGFADSRGSVRSKLSLSETRARTVAAGLIERGVPRDQLKIGALGSFAPVACDGTRDAPNEDGLRKNRRVEIWMK